MELEALQQRRAELDAASVNAMNSVWVLRGHLQEVEYQMKLLAEAALANDAKGTVE